MPLNRLGAVFMVFSHLADASQADDTTIRITGQTAGATPFISKLNSSGQQYERSQEYSIYDRSETRVCHPATVRHVCQFVPY